MYTQAVLGGVVSVKTVGDSARSLGMVLGGADARHPVTAVRNYIRIRAARSFLKKSCSSDSGWRSANNFGSE
jgi:hypothetical protein